MSEKHQNLGFTVTNRIFLWIRTPKTVWVFGYGLLFIWNWSVLGLIQLSIFIHLLLMNFASRTRKGWTSFLPLLYLFPLSLKKYSYSLFPSISFSPLTTTKNVNKEKNMSCHFFLVIWYKPWHTHAVFCVLVSVCVFNTII